MVHVEGLDVCFPQKKNLALRSAESTGTNTGGCSILAFTHSSNLDGFLISATCPVKHFALAKKELFMVPFFSWISLAIGGVPVDRNNRERAIGALQRSVDAVKDSRACLVVAPEGTRSTTGHLFGFKKGTFHMWEQMKVPIIPLVFVGAFDLYPKGNWVNDTGNVIIRYLPPIKPEEATSRDQMSRLLRRRILDSLCETSSDVLVTPLTWMQWSVHYSAILMLFVVDYFLYQLWLYIIYGYFQLENKTSIFLCASGISMGITLALYVYYVYIIGSSNEKKQKQK